MLKYSLQILNKKQKIVNETKQYEFYHNKSKSKENLKLFNLFLFRIRSRIRTSKSDPDPNKSRSDPQHCQKVPKFKKSMCKGFVKDLKGSGKNAAEFLHLPGVAANALVQGSHVSMSAQQTLVPNMLLLITASFWQALLFNI